MHLPAEEEEAAGTALKLDCRPATVLPSIVCCACTALGSKLAPTRVLMAAERSASRLKSRLVQSMHENGTFVSSSLQPLARATCDMTVDLMQQSIVRVQHSCAPDMIDEVEEVVVACAAAKGAASTATASTTRNTAIVPIVAAARLQPSDAS